MRVATLAPSNSEHPFAIHPEGRTANPALHLVMANEVRSVEEGVERGNRSLKDMSSQ